MTKEQIESKEYRQWLATKEQWERDLIEKHPLYLLYYAGKNSDEIDSLLKEIRSIKSLAYEQGRKEGMESVVESNAEGMWQELKVFFRDIAIDECVEAVKKFEGRPVHYLHAIKALLSLKEQPHEHE